MSGPPHFFQGSIMETGATDRQRPCPFVLSLEGRAGSESKFYPAATEMALTPGLLGPLRESFINRNLPWLFQMSDRVRPMSPDYSSHKKVALVAHAALTSGTVSRTEQEKLKKCKTITSKSKLKRSICQTTFSNLTLIQQLGGSHDLRLACLATSDIGHSICLDIIVYEHQLRRLYRFVLDTQLLCLALDQGLNRSGMRATLPGSSCHPVPWYSAQQ